MSLVTRCPSCATTFRALPVQLSARGGRVRCGKCAAIFDGVANLLTEEAIAALPAEPSPQMGLFDPRTKDIPPHKPAVAAETSPPDAFAIAPAVEVTTKEVDAAEVSPLEAEATETTEVDATAPDAAGGEVAKVNTTAVDGTAVDGAAVDAAPVSSLPEFLATPRPRSRYVLLWSVLSVLGLAALAGQAALHFRSEIAVLLPVTRSYLETACDSLGCEMRLPRRADLMSIESSDLQADGKRAGVIVLNALLRNRAPFAQEYPDLELTLTDQGDRAVIRRVLKPGEYLQRKSAMRTQGIPGGGEEAVRIHLETGNLPATGYQLFLFYPCPAASTSLFWQLSYPSRCQDSRNK